MAFSNNIEHVIPECEIIHDLENWDNNHCGACEVFENGGSSEGALDDVECTKNTGHLGFVGASEFSRDRLPQDIQTDDVFNLVKSYIDRTVMVVVKRTSLRRPDTYPNTNVPYPYSDMKGKTGGIRCGTGVIVQRWQFDSTSAPFEFVKGRPCPCYKCRWAETGLQLPDTEFAIVVITTATHVIFDDFEAEGSQFVLNYNCEEKKDEIKCLYGIGLNYETNERSEKVARSQTDRVRVKCITHDPELIQMLKDMEPTMHCRSYPSMGLSGVIVSHPHGRSKKVTFGNIVSRAFPKRDEESRFRHPPVQPYFSCGPETKCRMSSENSTLSSRQSFEKLIGSNNNDDDTITTSSTASDGSTNPGQQEVILQNGLSILIPMDAPYLCHCEGLSQRWVSFPSGTSFTSNRGRDWYVLPGLEVEMKVGNNDFPVRWFDKGYLTYDIKTCMGSSGAPVLYSERGVYCVYHSGAIRNGPNRSTVVHFQYPSQ